MAIKNLLNDLNDCPATLKKHHVGYRDIHDIVRATAVGTQLTATGIATSLYALEVAQKMLEMKGLFYKMNVINTSDLINYGSSLYLDANPLLILSRSGESAETVRLAHEPKGSRATISVTEGIGSTLSMCCKYMVGFSANETAFTNTKSFQLSIAYAVFAAKALGLPLMLTPQEYADEAAERVEKTLLCADHADRHIGKMMAEKNVLIIDGQGPLTGIVHQAVLDYQEIGTAAVASVGGVMRHGLIELTRREDAGVILMIPNDKAADIKVKLARDLIAAGTTVGIVAEEGVDLWKMKTIETVWIPKGHWGVTPIAFAAAMEKIYYYYARAKGLKDIKPTAVGKVTREE
ncbi:SIS domain-containing protein [Gehongia tenuis]|uniref:Glutamine--fructose-6-phosphate aminotransferase [isomerizing] n=1 Tax=Gehongia tenuis TaxID=2763655 RepID=A0A926HPB7_9FIRM|nr:hypothetical protein [Gehongia tenuis]MBC8530525.1 hypothetical protein [Gehongia tenuis]